MKIVATGQPAGGPVDKPKLTDPVQITLDVPVFYQTDDGPKPANPLITCDRAHAMLIYRVLNDWAVRHHFSIVHLGTYYPRQARKPNGKPIMYRGKPRWSGHSWGAIDWEGIITSDGQHLNANELEASAPAKYRELMNDLRAGIAAVHRTAEIVKEPHWRHLGLVPAGGW
jgi:hypothetical protein